jgi:glycosyltransferase involved in cell wall biosynthesis
MSITKISKIKVAIIHYWLDSYRGGEKVVETLCEIYPQADIYTHIYKPENLPEIITKHKVSTTFISKLPFASKYYRHYLPLMPIALKLLNLKKYDLIISSESGPAKGIRKGANALHVCYCHSPMRYIWDMEKEYIDSFKRKVKREKLKEKEKCSSNFVFRIQSMLSPVYCLLYVFLWKITACYMRCWDKHSSKNVDYFIANSKFIAARIRKFYKRKSTVIHPPCEINRFNLKTNKENFYLCASQLVEYKKVKMVVEAFNELGLSLCVIGIGNELDKIKKIAKNNIQILGKVSDKVLKEKFESCKAFVYAGKEDFGIVFVEAIAAGAPIIAFGKGGVRDIVKNGKTGLFFKNQTSESIAELVKKFENGKIKCLPYVEIAKSAKQFSKTTFEQKITDFINSKLIY